MFSFLKVGNLYIFKDQKLNKKHHDQRWSNILDCVVTFFLLSSFYLLFGSNWEKQSFSGILSSTFLLLVNGNKNSIWIPFSSFIQKAKLSKFMKIFYYKVNYLLVKPIITAYKFFYTLSGTIYNMFHVHHSSSLDLWTLTQSFIFFFIYLFIFVNSISK